MVLWLGVVVLPRALQGGLLVLVLFVRVVIFPADVHLVLFDGLHAEPILLDELRDLLEGAELVDVGEYHGPVEVRRAVALKLGHAPEMLAVTGGPAACHRVVAKLVGAGEFSARLSLESVAIWQRKHMRVPAIRLSSTRVPTS